MWTCSWSVLCLALVSSNFAWSPILPSTNILNHLCVWIQSLKALRAFFGQPQCFNLQAHPHVGKNLLATPCFTSDEWHYEISLPTVRHHSLIGITFQSYRSLHTLFRQLPSLYIILAIIYFTSMLILLLWLWGYCPLWLLEGLDYHRFCSDS